MKQKIITRSAQNNKTHNQKWKRNVYIQITDNVKSIYEIVIYRDDGKPMNEMEDEMSTMKYGIGASGLYFGPADTTATIARQPISVDSPNFNGSKRIFSEQNHVLISL